MLGEPLNLNIVAGHGDRYHGITRIKRKPGGMGEPATCELGPATAIAVFAATGKRLRKLPINAQVLSP
jgi:hypothetical protein